MYLEIINNNDDIIDAMGDAEVQLIVDLLKKDKNPAFLEILCNLCECSYTAKIGHQNRIVRMLLEQTSDVIFSTKLAPSRNDVLIQQSDKKGGWQSLRT